MKLFVLLLLVVGAYGFMLLSSTNLLLGGIQNYHATNDRVAATADQWSAGDTSVSFVAGR